MHPKRRSGRIAKELPIVLMGTDTTGKVFAEDTNTVVLSRHGAGIVSSHRFSPDEILILRLPSGAKEAEVRLVGQIGGEPGRYVYGLTFVDPNLDFWPMEFPPPEDFAADSRTITLECTFCQARQVVEHGEIEEDVYAVNSHVLRFCNACGTSTPWIKTRGEGTPNASPASPAVPEHAAVEPNATAPRSAGTRTAPTLSPSTSPPSVRAFPAVTPPDPSELSAPSARSSFLPPASQVAPANAGAAGRGTYSGAALEVLSMASVGDVALAEPPTVASPALAQDSSVSPHAPRPLDKSGRPVNRRKHVRVRVHFSACVRGEFGDDVVECENVSKGGLCFHSRQKYSAGAAIEVAAPFSPGEPAHFVPAKIRRVERLGDGQVFRYGAAYAPATASF